MQGSMPDRFLSGIEHSLCDCTSAEQASLQNSLNKIY